MNDQIRAPEIRVIDENGEQLGIISRDEGLRIARERELDLVEVAPQAVPPVCRVMDYSKYKYEQEKREREARKKQKNVHIKEIKLKPKIEEHDYQVKLQHLLRFLKKGDRVKVMLTFRGREMAHQEIGRQILDRLCKDSSSLGEVESGPFFEGKSIILSIIPK